MDYSLKLLLLATLAFVLYWLGHVAFIRRRQDRSVVAATGVMRAMPRFAVQWPVTIDTKKGRRQGLSQNISRSGMFVLLNPPLSLGQAYPARIEIPGGRTIEVRLEVVWTISEGNDEQACRAGMGVLFSELSDDDREYIGSWEKLRTAV